MTKVAILSVPAEGGVSYHAVSGGKQSVGKTAGGALDALTQQLTEEETDTLIIIQNLKPDQFFTGEQQARLAELFRRWRAARDDGQELPAPEQAELDALVETELRAATSRSRALLQHLEP